MPLLLLLLARAPLDCVPEQRRALPKRDDDDEEDQGGRRKDQTKMIKGEGGGSNERTRLGDLVAARAVRLLKASVVGASLRVVLRSPPSSSSAARRRGGRSAPSTRVTTRSVVPCGEQRRREILRNEPLAHKLPSPHTPNKHARTRSIVATANRVKSKTQQPPPRSARFARARSRALASGSTASAPSVRFLSPRGRRPRSSRA